MKVLKAAGLDTSSNPYDVPEGSFKQADNVVVRTKGVIEPRRGHDLLGYNFATDIRASEIVFFNGSAVINTNTNKLVHDTGAALTAYSGTYIAPDVGNTRMKFAEAASNLYFTTSTGVYELSALGDTPAPAGVMPAYDLMGRSSVSATRANIVGGVPNAAGNWLPVNSAVAYRAVIGVRDANGNMDLGAPSGRIVGVNPPTSSVAVGGLHRVTNVVTATTAAAHGFTGGEQFILDAAEANFGAGPFTVNTVPSATTLTYSETAADAVSANTHTISPGLKLTAFTILLDSTVSVSHFVQLYRTVAAPTSTIDPGDEQYLVYEAPVTAADIANGYILITDKTPETALSNTPLYINENTGDGADAGREQPPRCKDLCVWQNRMWAANTTSKQRFELRLLGVGSPDGVQDADVLMINGTPFQFLTPGSGSGGSEIQVINYSVTTTSPAANVRSATAALVAAVNTFNTLPSLNTVFRAKNLSAPDDPPGMLGLEMNALNAGQFYVATTRPTAFSPTLPQAFIVGTIARVGSTVTVTTTASHGFSSGTAVMVSASSTGAYADFPVGQKAITVTGATTFTYTEAGTAPVSNSPTEYYVHALTAYSDPGAKANGLAYSDLQLYEAFPLLNYLEVGARNSPIRRIVPLRDKLYVFKDDGLFTVSGTYPFRVDLLDGTVKVVGPDSVTVVSNRVFALTTQGIVSVTEAGAGIISRPIETDLFPLLTGATVDFKGAVFGVAYETERQYMLWLPTTASGAAADQAYVYHVLNNTWTKRTDTRTCGRVSPDDYLYLGSSNNATLSKERKTFTYLDYADESYSPSAYTAVSADGMTLTFASTALFSVGDYLASTFDFFAAGAITAVTPTTVTIDSGGVFPSVASGHTGTLGVKSYPCTLLYNPQTGGAPDTTKHHRAVTLHFGDGAFSYGYITSQSELSASSTSDRITVNANGFNNARKNIPLANQRGALLRVGFSLRQAFGLFKLYGYSVEAEVGSERTAR